MWSFLREKSRNMTSSWVEWSLHRTSSNQRNESFFEKDHEATERTFVNWMKNLHKASSCQRNESFFFENDDCILLSFDASWICENDRESAIMIVNLRKWRSVNCRSFFSSFRHLVNSRFSCSSRSVDIQSIVSIFLLESSTSSQQSIFFLSIDMIWFLQYSFS